MFAANPLFHTYVCVCVCCVEHPLLISRYPTQLTEKQHHKTAYTPLPPPWPTLPRPTYVRGKYYKHGILLLEIFLWWFYTIGSRIFVEKSVDTFSALCHSWNGSFYFNSLQLGTRGFFSELYRVKTEFFRNGFCGNQRIVFDVDLFHHLICYRYLLLCEI